MVVTEVEISAVAIVSVATIIPSGPAAMGTAYPPVLEAAVMEAAATVPAVVTILTRVPMGVAVAAAAAAAMAVAAVAMAEVDTVVVSQVTIRKNKHNEETDFPFTNGRFDRLPVSTERRTQVFIKRSPKFATCRAIEIRQYSQ